MTTLPRGRSFTRDDLAALPDDGNRYELVDGGLVVTPAPSRRHQLISSRLHLLLDAACPTGLVVLAAPLDFAIADDTTLQPDLVVVDRAVVDDDREPLRPLLVVEVLSPTTRLLDLHVKRERYASAGVPSYWIVDPGLAGGEPAAVVLELTAGEYAERGSARGNEALEVTSPVAVTVVPSRLLD